MEVVYIGSHPAVTGSAFTGVAERHGDPVPVTSREQGQSLIARGDFIEHTPEPVRPPVDKTKRSTT